MIHCPCENELGYLLQKPVMLEEKCLLGKYKYKATVINEAETMKLTGSLVLAPTAFAHRNYSKLPGYVCSVPSSHLDKTPAHTCANHSLTFAYTHQNWLSHSQVQKWSGVMQVYDMDMHPGIFVFRATNYKFCCLLCSA